MFKCTVCLDKDYYNRYYRDQHMKESHGFIVHDCEYCDFEFETAKELKQHQVDKYSLRCCMCKNKKIYFNRLQLDRHQIRKHNVIIHNCEYCGEIFESHREAFVHAYFTHTGPGAKLRRENGYLSLSTLSQLDICMEGG